MAGVADYEVPTTRSRRRGLPRRRGAVNGLLLILLGAWGGLVPFFGPRIGLSYTSDPAWTITWAKVWLEVLPAVAVVIGALGLIGTAARAGGVFWGWLAALGGAWFMVGQTVSQLWTHGRGEFGAPAAATVAGRTVEELVFFYGLGAVIVFLAGVAIGRFTVPVRQDAAAITSDDIPAPAQPIDPMPATDSTSAANRVNREANVTNRDGKWATPTTTMAPVRAKHSLPTDSAASTSAVSTSPGSTSPGSTDSIGATTPIATGPVSTKRSDNS